MFVGMEWSGITWALVALLCAGESRTVLLSRSIDFRSCRRLPLVHRGRYLVSIQGLRVDHVMKTSTELCDRSLRCLFPFCCQGETIEHCYVGVNVEPLHTKLHQLIICLLLLGSVCEGAFEGCFKLGPQDFVCFAYEHCLCRVRPIDQMLLLSIHPVVDVSSPDIGEGSKHLVERFEHGIIESVG